MEDEKIMFVDFEHIPFMTEKLCFLKFHQALMYFSSNSYVLSVIN
jgi:hypothetical protein